MRKRPASGDVRRLAAAHHRPEYALQLIGHTSRTPTAVHHRRADARLSQATHAVAGGVRFTSLFEFGERLRE